MTTLSTLARLSHVVRVLFKYGLGPLIKQAGLLWHVPPHKRILIAKQLPPDLPIRLRKAMEELGGAYVKFGQMLSLRPDLVPAEYREEFSKLLDRVPPEPYEKLIPHIEQSLGKPLKRVFSHIDHKPLGSASVAQVHKARLKTGEAVVIKIQRPNIAKTFAKDIEVLHVLARALDKHLSSFNPALVVDDFEAYTLHELDFHCEAENIERVRQALRKRKDVHVPHVYWSYTTTELITMDYLEGALLSQTHLTDQQKKAVAKKLFDVGLELLVDHGIFHADLHPGNILLMKRGSLGLIDFGIFGEVDEHIKQLTIKLYVSIVTEDIDSIQDMLLTYGEPSADTDIASFKREIRHIYRRWRSREGSALQASALMMHFFRSCTRHQIRLPPDTALYGKAFMTLESTARTLDPTFNFITYTEKKLVEALKRQKAPKKVIQEYIKNSKEAAKALAQLPSRSLRVIEKLEQGEFGIQLKDKSFRHIGWDIELSSNRLSYALISASCIIAGSQLVEVGPQLHGYGLLALSLLAVAFFFVILLFRSIFREGSPRHDPHPDAH